LDRCQNARNEWPKIAHAITHTQDQNDANTDVGQVLLMTKGFVCRDEYFETSISRCSQENAVSQAQPPLRTDGRYFVTG